MKDTHSIWCTCKLCGPDKLPRRGPKALVPCVGCHAAMVDADSDQLCGDCVAKSRRKERA